MKKQHRQVSKNSDTTSRKSIRGVILRPISQLVEHGRKLKGRTSKWAEIFEKLPIDHFFSVHKKQQPYMYMLAKRHGVKITTRSQKRNRIAVMKAKK
jgi:hypothetical protein